MKIQDYLEQDREKLLSDLAQNKTPERAVPVLQSELDRLVYRYNAECETEQLRECAAGMAEAVKAACGLADTVREVKVWERTLPSENTKKKDSFLPLAGAGGGLAALGVLLSVLLHPLGIILSAVLPSLAFVAGSVLLFLSGRKAGKKQEPEARATEKHTESLVDAEKMYRYLKAAALVMDRRLDELAEELRYLHAEGAAGDQKELSDAETALFADLLEALYCEDGAFALERLKGLSYYLHSLGIELTDYSENTKELFDRMPGADAHTIRPALTREGKVLKKGLAVTG